MKLVKHYNYKGISGTYHEFYSTAIFMSACILVHVQMDTQEEAKEEYDCGQNCLRPCLDRNPLGLYQRIYPLTGTQYAPSK